MATRTAPAPTAAAGDAAAPSKKQDKNPEQKAPKKRSRKKLLIAVAVLLAAAGAAAYLTLGSKGPATPPPPKPGIVLKLNPVTLNLRDGHYLKLGLALQATAKAPKDLDGSKALDLAIALFSDRSVTDLSSAQAREKAKAELLAQVEKAYPHEVMDVYFTEFVMQ